MRAAWRKREREKKRHRQQNWSRRANPNERVNDVTSPAGRDLQLAECVVSCIESSRSCRLVAGMHSTSFVLGKGVGVFDSSSVSLFKQRWAFGESVVFIVGFIRSQQQTPYRRLHCRSLVCFVDHRDEEAAGKIAKSSLDLAIPPPFPEQKEKNSFHE